MFIAEDFYPNFIGGGGIYGYKLVQGLSKLGFNLTVLTEKRLGRIDFWHKTKNVDLILTPFCFGNQLFLAVLQYIFFKIKLSNSRFDIIHATQLSGLFFTLFKPKNAQKIVITLHHTYYDMFKESDSILQRLFYLPLIFLEKWMYQRADAVLFHTPFEKEAVKNYYNLKNPLMGTVYLGVDMPNIKLRDQIKAKKLIAQKIDLDKNEQVVLYVGRLVKRKKVDTLLKSLRMLYDQDIKVRGVVIGKGKEKDNLIKIAPPNVTFLGFVEDTKPYFLASEVFVLTSVAEGGIALSVLEAASFGLPLIISPSVAGFPILRESKNGFIVNPDDAKKLATRIKQILPHSKKMGRVSREYAKMLSWQKCIKNTTNFYHQVLERT